jgi:hypothetical protein
VSGDAEPSGDQTSEEAAPNVEGNPKADGLPAAATTEAPAAATVVGSLANRLRNLASQQHPSGAAAVPAEEEAKAPEIAPSPSGPRLSPDPRRRIEPLLAFAKRPASPAQGGKAAESPPMVEQPTIPARRPGGIPMPQNRRLHRRVSLAAEIEIDGTPSRLIDLSMGGFAAADTPPLASESVLPVTLRMTIDGIEISTRLSARIIYVQLSRVGGRFMDLTASQTAFLRYIVTWRGQSVGAIGTTTLLDAITRPDRGRGFDAADGERPQRQRWWSRWFSRLRVPLIGSRQ